MKVDVGAPRHVHPKAGVEKVVQSRAAVVPDVELLERGTVRDEEPAFRPPIVARFKHLLSQVDTVHKSGLGLEVGAEIEIPALQIEQAPGSLQIDFVSQTVQ